MEERERNKASPPAPCFSDSASFTNSNLWFPEEGGEWLVVEMKGIVCGLIRSVDIVNN